MPSSSNKKAKAAPAPQSAPAKVVYENIPDEFKSVIVDFIRDIRTTFPEYEEVVQTFSEIVSAETIAITPEQCVTLYEYSRDVYPPRFFDLLYKNDKMFDDSSINVAFLPGIDFRILWKTDISDNTRDAIWKYLQLIMFSIINNVSDAGSFGDTAKLFEAIDEGELKNKLEEVIESMNGMFGAGGGAGGEGASGDAGGGEGSAEEFMKRFMSGSEGASGDGAGAAGGASGGMPNPDSIHQHLSGLLNGKIGTLAKEIAEETAKDLDIDMTSESSVKGVFQQLFKNPGKLSGLVKTVGEKLDKKLKSGELKESEIMQEASDLMSKMKSMPGMGNIASMLSQMGMPMPDGLKGNAKVNVGAMQSQLQRNIRQAKMRERMVKKLNENKDASSVVGETTHVFSTGEQVERTPRVKQVSAVEAERIALANAAALLQEEEKESTKKSSSSGKKKNKK
jgi:NADP-dependent 3-hydroxy acid dehydrogenase YdfG